MKRPIRTTIAALAAALLVAAPAAAQYSDSYKFLKAVRDHDGAKVQEALDAPGAPVINTRDYNTGESALHILVKRRDAQWLGFLIVKGAKVDQRDNDGNTPLIAAAQIGFSEGVATLLEGRAAVDAANNRGETPLIFAVHNRDLATVRLLLAAGADPNRSDRVSGKSARQYATDDPRAAPILKVIQDAKPAKKAAVMGPSL